MSVRGSRASRALPGIDAPRFHHDEGRVVARMKALCFAFSLFLFSAALAEPPAATGFLRTAERADKTTAVETLSAEFRPASGAGPAVWLIGVAHIGTPEYYAAIQARLDRHTVVLYEGIGIEEVKRGPGAATHEAGVQAGLARALGLVFQLDAIDYRRPHFINSDMKVDTIESAVKDKSAATAEKTNGEPPADRTFDMLMDALRGEGQLGAMINGFIAALGKSPEMQEMTKAILVEVLGRAGEFIGMAQSISPALRDLFEVILTERNAVVLADLRAQLAKLEAGQSVAIFYGAAHMDEISRRLREEMHYLPAKEEWDTAFSADPAKAGMNSAQLRFMIELAKWQLRAMQPAAK